MNTDSPGSIRVIIAKNRWKEALDQFHINHEHCRHHDLTRSVMEVCVRHQGTELEDLACSSMRLLNTSFLVWESLPQLQDSSFKRSQRMSHIESESKTLAEKVLTGQNLFTSGIREHLRKLAEGIIDTISFASEEQTCLQKLGRGV